MEKDYTSKVFKRVLILCWLTLAICFIIKIFGGNFFNVICNNDEFINFCNFIQNSFWYYVVGFLSNFIITIILWSSMCGGVKPKAKEILICFAVILGLYALQVLANIYNSLMAAMCFSVLKFIILPFVLFKASIKRIVFVNIFDLGMQVISAFVKNISIVKTIYDNVLITLIFAIDYYIMLIILWLYLYQKRSNKNMGLFGSWFLHKTVAELEAILPTLKDKNEIKACKERIEQLKKEEDKK